MAMMKKMPRHEVILFWRASDIISAIRLAKRPKIVKSTRVSGTSGPDDSRNFSIKDAAL
jgi:hypothetical protein|tara:strand:- start:450 stop:626 length:177 start_codon:yes stop_codon:yes gene_type:complete